MPRVVEDGARAAPEALTTKTVRRMCADGVLALPGGARGKVVKLTPPLTLSLAEGARAVEALAS